MGDWVSVEDRLPEKSVSVLVAILDGDGSKHTVKAYYISEDGCFEAERGGIYMGVTHWMPFPQPPETYPTITVEAITFAEMRMYGGAIVALTPEGTAYYSIDEGEHYRGCDAPTSKAVQAIIAYADKLEKETGSTLSPWFVSGDEGERTEDER